MVDWLTSLLIIHVKVLKTLFISAGINIITNLRDTKQLFLHIYRHLLNTVESS